MCVPPAVPPSPHSPAVAEPCPSRRGRGRCPGPWSGRSQRSAAIPAPGSPLAAAGTPGRGRRAAGSARPRDPPRPRGGRSAAGGGAGGPRLGRDPRDPPEPLPGPAPAAASRPWESCDRGAGSMGFGISLAPSGAGSGEGWKGPGWDLSSAPLPGPLAQRRPRVPPQDGPCRAGGCSSGKCPCPRRGEG